jgi:opacity protein-like surface antigen
MKRLPALAGLLLVLATLLYCADATGKWKGSIDAPDGTHDLTFDLKASGDNLTGAIGGVAGEASEIKDGKIQGDTVTFWAMVDYQGQAIKLVFKGQVLESEIHFTMGLDDGSWSTDFVAKKAM